MSRRTYSRNAYESALNGAISSGTTSIAVDSATGLTAPCYLTIAPETPTKREVILVNSISVNTLNVTRGLAGSTSGAQAQSDGAVIRAIPVHQTLDDIFDDIEDLEDHVGGTTTADHPEATTSTRGFLSATDKSKLDSLVAANQVTGGDLHDHFGGDGAQIAHSSLSGITPATSNHVTGGDSHNHQGGDGGTINHSALAGLATGDEHTQYLLVNGTRQMAGNLDPDGHLTRNLGFAGQSWNSVFFGAIYEPSGGIRINLAGATPWLQGGDWNTDGGLMPTTDVAYDLGDATFAWRRVYAQAIYDDLGAAVFDTEATSALAVYKTTRPNVDATLDLGATSYSWRRLYVSDIYSNAGTQTVDVDARQLLGGNWDMAGSFLPTVDNGYDLGTAANNWRRLYVSDLYNAAGTQTIDVVNRQLLNGAWDVAGDFLPTTDNTRDLGSASARWNQLHVGAGSAAEPAIEIGETDVGFINSVANGIGVVLGGVNRIRFSGNGNFFGPETDNDMYSGQSGNRWISVWAVNSAIQTSDLNTKKDVQPLDRGLEKVRAISPINFTRDGRRYAFFGAQDVLPYIPEAVVVPDDGTALGMMPDAMIATLWQAVRELDAKFDSRESVTV